MNRCKSIIENENSLVGTLILKLFLDKEIPLVEKKNFRASFSAIEFRPRPRRKCRASEELETRCKDGGSLPRLDKLFCFIGKHSH